MSKEFENWLHEFDEAGLVRDCDIVITEWMQATWQAAREIDAKRIAELENEVATGTFACDLLNKLLAEICITLKGEPPYLTLSSYHDLPQLVAELESQNKVMREALEKLCALSGNPNVAERKYDLMWEIANRSLKKEG